MNRLSVSERAEIVGCLVEGNSIRATSRITGAAKNTIVGLLVRVGEGCAAYQDRAIRNLGCKRVQCDEIWSFCHAKQKNLSPEKQGVFGYGDVWTWTAIDAETKLVLSFTIGDRDTDTAHVSTSFVERQNLTMRMSMRRFTRLTNGFSKKVENLTAAVALHFMHYNYCQAHQTLTKANRGRVTTPAMAAGLATRPWTLEEIVNLEKSN